MSDVSGLVVFLRARLDEDEAVARAATDGPWAAWEKRGLHGLGDLIHPVRTPGQMTGSHATIVTASWLDAEHIARHDPARVLAEIAAKRQLVDLYVDTARLTPEMPGASAVHWTLRPVLRKFAEAFAAHPDYQREWSRDA